MTMHHSSSFCSLCLCACAALLVHCGGSDQPGSTSVGTAGSSSFAGTGGSRANVGGAGYSTGGAGQSSPGEVVLFTGLADSRGLQDGPGALGVFTNPVDVVSDGSHLYILEGYESNRVRALDMATGAMRTLAGSGVEGSQDGVGKAATFYDPVDLTIDPSHQNLYVADARGIRKVVIATGEVSTFAKFSSLQGTGAGDGTTLASAEALAMDSSGQHLYVADALAHQIRVFDMATGQMSTLAGSLTQGSTDGVGSDATLCGPFSFALDPTDTRLYFADQCHFDVIRVLDIPSRQVTSIVGSATYLNFDDGVGAGAGFNSLRAIALDADGTHLYSTEATGTRHQVRQIDLASKTVTTIAGSNLASGSKDDEGINARFDFPLGLTVVNRGLYIADSGNREIRKMDLETRQVTTYAGALQPATMNDPVSAVTDGTFLYVVDKDNNAIRKVSIATSYTTTLAGTGAFGSLDGPGKTATFNFPSGIALAGSQLFVADTSNQVIRAIDLGTTAVTTLAGTVGKKGATDGIGTAASFNAPQGLVADPSGQSLYVTDQFNHQIRKIVIATGQVSTLVGAPESGLVDGVGAAARFNMPANITVDAKGTALYVTDASNNAIRKIDIASARVTTLAGSPTAGKSNGIGTAAHFDTPWGIVTDGPNLYVADAANGLIRKVELATSAVSIQCGRTLFEYEDGTCAKALFQTPAGLALDATASWLYVCESGFNQIRAVSLK